MASQILGLAGENNSMNPQMDEKMAGQITVNTAQNRRCGSSARRSGEKSVFSMNNPQNTK